MSEDQPSSESDTPEIESKTVSHDTKKLDFDYLKLTHDYSWNWLQYHANQRMTVFRFFFIIIAILAAGYLRAVEANSNGTALLLASISMMICYLFWRTDIRSWDLIKIAESSLKVTEKALAERQGTPSICLATIADLKDTKIARDYRSRFFFSFKQTIWAMYTLFAAVSAVAAAIALWPFASKLFCLSAIGQ